MTSPTTPGNIPKAISESLPAVQAGKADEIVQLVGTLIERAREKALVDLLLAIVQNWNPPPEAPKEPKRKGEAP